MMTVIIPTLVKSPHLRGLLERLKRQVTTFEIEVLVVANLPSQPLRQLVKSMDSRFHYYETGRLGVNYARNKAIDKARGEILLFLDDDIVLLNDGLLQAHWDAHARYENAAAVGGPYELITNRSRWDQAYHQIAHQWLRASRLEDVETTQLLGGNMSIKRDRLVNIMHDRFDEEILFGGSESALCQRMVLKGQSLVFLDTLKVGHSPELSRRRFIRKAFLQGRGAKWRQDHLQTVPFQNVNEWLFREPETSYVSNECALYSKHFARGQKLKRPTAQFRNALRAFFVALSGLNRAAGIAGQSNP